MKGSLTGGQYVLQGRAIAWEATAVTSESHDHDPTLVWPRRLGHRSEEELQDLGKQNLMDRYGGTTVRSTRELEYVHAYLWAIWSSFGGWFEVRDDLDRLLLS